MPEKIGLEAVFDDVRYQAGVTRYIKTLNEAIRLTRVAQGLGIVAPQFQPQTANLSALQASIAQYEALMQRAANAATPWRDQIDKLSANLATQRQRLTEINQQLAQAMGAQMPNVDYIERLNRQRQEQINRIRSTVTSIRSEIEAEADLSLALNKEDQVQDRVNQARTNATRALRAMGVELGRYSNLQASATQTALPYARSIDLLNARLQKQGQAYLKLVEDLTRLRAADEQDTAAIGRKIAALRQQAAQIQAVQGQIQKQVQSANAAQAALTREQAAQVALNAARSRAVTFDAAMQAGTARIRAETDAYVNSLREVTPQVERYQRAVHSTLDNLNRQGQYLGIAQQQLARSRVLYGDNAVITQQFAARVNSLTAAIDRSNASLQAHRASLQAVSQRAQPLAGVLRGLNTTVLQLAASFGLVLGVQELAQQMRRFVTTGFESVRAYELLGFALQSLAAREIIARNESLGMAEAFNLAAVRSRELLDWIDDLSGTAPFSRDAIANSLRLAQAYGFTSEEAQRLVQAQLDLAAGAGFTDDQLSRISLALGQIRSRGKLAGEEIRQLTEAGIPALQILSKAMGITTTELIQMYERGFVPASTAIEAIVSSFETDFGGAAARSATETYQGLLSVLENIIKIDLRILFESLFEELKPLAKDLIDTLKDPAFQRSIRSVAYDMAEFTRNLVSAVQTGSKLAGALDFGQMGKDIELLSTELQLVITALETLGIIATEPVPDNAISQLRGEVNQLIKDMARGGMLGGLLGIGKRAIGRGADVLGFDIDIDLTEKLQELTEAGRAINDTLRVEGVGAVLRYARALATGSDEAEEFASTLRGMAMINAIRDQQVRATDEYADALDRLSQKARVAIYTARSYNLDFVGRITDQFRRAASGLPDIGDRFLRNIFPTPEALEGAQEYIEAIRDLNVELRDLGAEHAATMNELASEMGQINRDATQEIGEAWADLNDELADLDEDRNERWQEYYEEVADMEADLAEQILDTETELNDALAELADDRMEKELEWREQLAEATDDYNEKIVDNADKTGERIRDLTQRFTDRMRDLQRQIDDILGDIPASAIAKYPDKPLERFLTVEGQKRLRELRRRMEDERAEYDRELGDIREDAQEEIDDNKEKHEEQIKNLQRRMDKERAEYDKRAQELREDAADEIADAREAHAEQLAALRERLDKEEAAYQERRAELIQQTQEEVTLIRQRQQEQLAEVQKRLAEERREYAAAQAEIRREIARTTDEYNLNVRLMRGATDEWTEALLRASAAIGGPNGILATAGSVAQKEQEYATALYEGTVQLYARMEARRREAELEAYIRERQIEHMQAMEFWLRTMSQYRYVIDLVLDSYFRGQSPSPFEENLQGMIDRLTTLSGGQWRVPIGASMGGVTPPGASYNSVRTGGVNVSVLIPEAIVREEADIGRLSSGIAQEVMGALLSGQQTAIAEGDYFPRTLTGGRKY